MVRDSSAHEKTASMANIAPLEDEEMLGAVCRGLAEVIIPELARLGADEFIISQTRSLMSVVGFVRRGLYERQVAREQCERSVAVLKSRVTSESAALEELRRLVRIRLDSDITGRTVRDSA